MPVNTVVQLDVIFVASGHLSYSKGWILLEHWPVAQGFFLSSSFNAWSDTPVVAQNLKFYELLHFFFSPVVLAAVVVELHNH